MTAQHPLARRTGGPEDRMIRARLAHYNVRRHDLEAYGVTATEASKQAFDEARRLHFNRKGEPKAEG